MIERIALCVTLQLAVAFAFAKTAWADVPPPDACYEQDEPCTWGSDATTGMCRIGKCTRGTPDGAVSYDCLRCVHEDPASTTGNSTSTTTTTSSTGSDTTTISTGDDAATDDFDCRCSVPGGANERWLSAAMLGIGLVALLWSRRRTRS